MQYKLHRLLEILQLLLYDSCEVKIMRERSQSFDPRQVMRRDSFEVFHYREPRPGTVEVHHHDFYEVYYLLSGKVEYWVDGRIIAMQPGDLLLINPLELHRPVVDPGSPVYERIVLWINKEYLEGLHRDTMDLSRCFDTSLPAHTHLIRPDSSQRGELTARLGELVREASWRPTAFFSSLWCSWGAWQARSSCGARRCSSSRCWCAAPLPTSMKT